MSNRRRADRDPDTLVQADPEELAVFARALLDGEDVLRRDVVELEHALVTFHRRLAASASAVRLPDPLPDVLACLDDRVTLSAQITRLAGAFDQVGDMRMAELDR